MRTLVWTAPEKMEIQETKVPELLPHEVLIRVEAVGICGSEIEGYLGHNSLRIPPLVMGHEFCGRITEMGNEVTGLKSGAKVVVNPLISCGRCIRCIRGFENLCDRRKIIGIHCPGAFAEYVSVPASAVVAVPEELSGYLASLAEPLACSLRAVRRAIVDHPFSNVVVFGAGTIGLLSAAVAKRLGAHKAIVLDTNVARLQTAIKAGADAAFDPTDGSLEANMRDHVLAKGIDVVIDAAGFQQTREKAIAMLNPGGTLMNIGLGVDQTRLPINTSIRNEISVLSSFCYTRQDFASSVQLLASGFIKETEWSEIRPLSEGQSAFADLTAGKVGNSKIFLNPTA